MVQDSIDILALFITKNDAVDLPYRLRSALLRHVDVAQLNVDLYLKSQESKLAHGGYLQGQQAVFATFLGKHDRTAEAEALFKMVLSQQTQKLGPSSIAVLATTNNLAGLYLRLRRFEEAELHLKKVLDGKLQHFSQNDIRIANTINELGNVCSQLGRFEEAKSFYMKNLAIFLQDENSSVNNLKIVYNNLGEIALRQGSYVEANNMFKKASEQGRNGQPTCQVVGQTNCDTPLDEIDCQILINKGRVLNCVGKFERAHEMLKRASDGLLKLLGPKHSKVIAAERELALTNPSEGHAIIPKETEALWSSGAYAESASIHCPCANWGSTMPMWQSQLLNLERKAEQTNLTISQQQMAILHSRLEGALDMPAQMPQSSLLSPRVQDPANTYLLSGQQVSHTFLSRDKKDGSLDNEMDFDFNRAD